MPVNGKHDAIARQWELLKLLPSHGTGRSAKDLMQLLAEAGFAVSKRTVERDLVALSRLFPLEADERSEPFGWRWSANAQLDLPSLAISEAFSLRLLEQFLKPILPASVVSALEPRFRLASAKLGSLGTSNSTSRWADKLRVVSPSQNLLPPVIASGVLVTVQDALLADDQLRIAYRNIQSDRANEMRVHPLALVQEGAVTYLVATIADHANVRLLAMHRIEAAKKLDDRVRRPAAFSLDAYLASGALQFGSGEQISLEARLAPRLERVLRETPLSSDMTLSTKGAETLMTATVADTWQLHWWILSQGDGVVVVRPARLRKLIAKRVRDAARCYDPPP